MLRKFFLPRRHFAPNGPDLGEKAGQKWPVAPKKRGILTAWSMAHFYGPKFSTVLDFSPRRPDRQPFSLPNDNKLKIS